MHDGPAPAVVAVVVSYERRDLLVESLAALAAQTTPLAAVVVVDNASTDGSADAAQAAGVDVVRLVENVGGAGGFAVGVAAAVSRHPATHVWLLDDDTIPTPTALTELLDAMHAAGRGTVVAGSRVVWTDGLEHPMNTPRANPFATAAERRAASAARAVPIRSTSFVSLLADADAVRRVGLPIADYFIWNDDFEYSTRLLRRGRGVHVPASVVEHRTKARADTDVDPGPRFYYEVRNKRWMFARSRSLGPLEKLVYGGSSLVRWARTVVRSADRATLLDAGRRGWRDGARPPRRDADVVRAALADEPELLAAVAALSGRG